MNFLYATLAIEVQNDGKYVPIITRETSTSIKKKKKSFAGHLDASLFPIVKWRRRFIELYPDELFIFTR